MTALHYLRCAARDLRGLAIGISFVALIWLALMVTP